MRANLQDVMCEPATSGVETSLTADRLGAFLTSDFGPIPTRPIAPSFLSGPIDRLRLHYPRLRRRFDRIHSYYFAERMQSPATLEGDNGQLILVLDEKYGHHISDLPPAGVVLLVFLHLVHVTIRIALDSHLLATHRETTGEVASFIGQAIALGTLSNDMGVLHETAQILDSNTAGCGRRYSDVLDFLTEHDSNWFLRLENDAAVRSFVARPAGFCLQPYSIRRMRRYRPILPMLLDSAASYADDDPLDRVLELAY